MAKDVKTEKQGKKGAETRVTLVETFRNTRKKVSDKVTEYNEKYVAKTIERGREKAKMVNEKYVSQPLEKGIANGKKMIRNIPMVSAIEKKMNDRLNELPTIFNMPSKGEIEKLTLALESLNTNIENLSKQK